MLRLKLLIRDPKDKKDLDRIVYDAIGDFMYFYARRYHFRCFQLIAILYKRRSINYVKK